jgi:hypothetical protein
MAKRHRKPNRNLPNPMGPGSPDFATRNAQVSADIGGGIMRVDVGSPAGLVRDLTRGDGQA